MHFLQQYFLPNFSVIFVIVRELRQQLEAVGGPWGDDTSWLFGGTLMESSHTVQHYGLNNKAVLDVVPGNNLLYSITGLILPLLSTLLLFYL